MIKYKNDLPCNREKRNGFITNFSHQDSHIYRDAVSEYNKLFGDNSLFIKNEAYDNLGTLLKHSSSLHHIGNGYEAKRFWEVFHSIKKKYNENHPNLIFMFKTEDFEKYRKAVLEYNQNETINSPLYKPVMILYFAVDYGGRRTSDSYSSILAMRNDLSDNDITLIALRLFDYLDGEVNN